jgi:hypothetical protein
MPDLFDELSRILGSQMPRRDAIRRIVFGVAASQLGFLWPRRAAAAGDFCSPGHCDEANRVVCANGACCPSLQVCCFAANGDCLCCPFNQCCPGKCCGRCEKCVGGQCVPCNGACDKCVGGNCGNRCPPLGQAALTRCCVNKNTGQFGACCKPDCCNEETGQCMGAGFRVSAYRTDVGEIDVEVRSYGGVGLASITVLESVNADIRIPAFTPGTMDYVEVTGKRVDPSKPARMALRAIPDCGCPTCGDDGDPVLAQVQIPRGGNQRRESFANIPAAEHYVMIQNGTPGLRRVQLLVNGRHLPPRWLRDDMVRTIDIGPAMLAKNNIVTVIANGRPETSALVLISDVAPDKDGAANAMRVDWRPGPLRPGVDLHWGR